MTNIPNNAEKMRQVYTLGITGCLLGALLLPFLLPLKEIRENRRPSRYTLRLVLTAVFFLPNIIIRLMGEEAYQSNPVNSGIMALGNGVIITLMHGFIFSMTGRYRLFWIALAFSAGNFAYSLLTGHGRELLQPFLFFGSGLFLTIAGIFLFVYLTSNKFCAVPRNEDMQELNNSEVEFHPNVSKLKHLPYFLFPLIAALIIFMANSFTNQLFFMVLNSPLPPGFNLSNIVLILTLPLLGFLAALSWRRFLMFFIPVCSVILLLAPSLLLFTHSQPLFLVLYTLNAIVARMITAVFPFMIVDMFWRYERQRKTNNHVYLIAVGVLGWFLPVSIQMISISASIPKNIFNLIQHDKPSAVTLLTVVAIAFYILMWLVNKNPAFDGKNETGIAGSVKNLDAFFKEYQLTDKEVKIACLLFEEGITSEEIAGRILRSKATVSSHLTNIFKKLNVQSRTEFMAKVLKTMNSTP